MSASHLEDLEQQMEAAVAALDFETAARLRDQIQDIRRDNRVRAIDGAPQASYFQRQVPGKMGLGTDQQVYAPPEGWVPPSKSDPMTAGHSRGARRRKS